MEHENDPRLRELLKEWAVPGAPGHLDERVLRQAARGWRFWIHGSIRVPVPVGVAAVALLAVLAGLVLYRQPVPASAPEVPSFNLADFRPAEVVNVRVIGGDDVP